MRVEACRSAATVGAIHYHMRFKILSAAKDRLLRPRNVNITYYDLRFLRSNKRCVFARPLTGANCEQCRRHHDHRSTESILRTAMLTTLRVTTTCSLHSECSLEFKSIIGIGHLPNKHTPLPHSTIRIYINYR